jgi:septum formation protein
MLILGRAFAQLAAVFGPMTLSPSTPLVLGSASPRRREILSSMGIPIVVVKGDVDETWRTGELPGPYLERVVREKLADVVRRLEERTSVPGVVVADTIVVLGDEILGKPKDVIEAMGLVSRLVGRSHVVRTRYAVSIARDLERPWVERTVESIVTMRGASTDEVRRYAETGEGLDKAGAYAAQGIGAFLIESIEGSFSNVVGLPACEIVLDLEAAGLLREFPRVPA